MADPLEVRAKLEEFGMDSERMGRVVQNLISGLMARLPPLEIVAVLRLAELAHDYAERRVHSVPDWERKRAQIIAAVEEGHELAQDAIAKGFS